jgi:hypothetical protein
MERPKEVNLILLAVPERLTDRAMETLGFPGPATAE